MLQNLISVYDSKAEAYLTPFFIATDGMAVRSISDALDNPEHPFTKHPEDFTLIRLGLFDDTTGKYDEIKETLGTILEIKAQKENNIINLGTGNDK